MKKIPAILFFVFIGIPIGITLFIVAELLFITKQTNKEYPNIDHDLDDSYIRQSKYLIESKN